MAAPSKSRLQSDKPRRRSGPRGHQARRFALWPTSGLLSLLAAGCATAPLERAGTLQSYDELAPSNGVITRSLLKVSKADVLTAKTVRIVPTAFFAPAERSAFTEEQRSLVTNAVDRALCAGLSERFKVIAPSEPADLTIRAVVTHVAPTDPVAVGLSKGASLAKSVLLPGVPVPIPRIPIGLGSLSLEAEARDRRGTQKAAMIWGRGANAFFGSGRIAENGDAYNLASSFGDDFSKLVVTGTTPFGSTPELPSIESVSAFLGAAPKYPACEAFGKSPGLVGLIGEGIGVPPNWTDNGAATGRN